MEDPQSNIEFDPARTPLPLDDVERIWRMTAYRPMYDLDFVRFVWEVYGGDPVE
jgi:hypothetical protein